MEIIKFVLVSLIFRVPELCLVLPVLLLKRGLTCFELTWTLRACSRPFSSPLIPICATASSKLSTQSLPELILPPGLHMADRHQLSRTKT